MDTSRVISEAGFLLSLNHKHAAILQRVTAAPSEPLTIYPSTDLPIILQLAPFISWVDSFVPSQVAGRRERQVANLAFVRLLPRMRPHVRSQAAGL